MSYAEDVARYQQQAQQRQQVDYERQVAALRQQKAQEDYQVDYNQALHGREHIKRVTTRCDDSRHRRSIQLCRDSRNRTQRSTSAKDKTDLPRWIRRTLTWCLAAGRPVRRRLFGEREILCRCTEATPASRDYPQSGTTPPSK